MTAAHIAMGIGAAALAARSTWQHLGRTPASRAWTSTIQGSLTRRSVLIVQPLLVVVLLSGAATGLVDSSTAGSFAVAVPAVAALAVLLAYLILPLPIPRSTRPDWERAARERPGPRRLGGAGHGDRGRRPGGA